MHTWFLTLLASRANLRVLTVSGQLATAGEMLAIMTVLEFPPKESWVQQTETSATTALCCAQVLHLQSAVRWHQGTQRLGQYV
jgi:hypothetical protein